MLGRKISESGIEYEKLRDVDFVKHELKGVLKFKGRSLYEVVGESFF